MAAKHIPRYAAVLIDGYRFTQQGVSSKKPYVAVQIRLLHPRVRGRQLGQFELLGQAYQKVEHGPFVCLGDLAVFSVKLDAVAVKRNVTARYHNSR